MCAREEMVMADKPSKAKLYAQAEQMLRERHLGEFQVIVSDLYAEHGYEYKRRLTAAERAELDRWAALKKAEAALEKAKAKVASLGGDAAPAQAVEKSVDDFAGPQVVREPFGAAHPVDPKALEESGFPV